MDSEKEEQLLQVIRSIFDGSVYDELSGPEGEAYLDELHEMLQRETGCPHINDLIYWTKGLTPEDVLSRALAYRPIQLGWDGSVPPSS